MATQRQGCRTGTALILGHDAAGVDSDLKAVEAYAAYLKTYLRRKRLKHTAEVSPVRREGKALGRRDAWLVHVVDEALLVWDGDDGRYRKLHGSLERRLGDDLWVVEPG